VKRPSYRDAIFWLANNDDCYWLEDEHGSPSVSTCCVADMFEVPVEKVTRDLRREIAKESRK
jgi:hypothetical protein